MPARSPAPRLALAALTFALTAGAAPVLHERIPPDPRDDLAMGVTLDGNLPAALETPSGLVRAPDPRRPVRRGVTAPPSAGGAVDAARSGKYVADTDTRRPNLLPYDEPFTPSTAPFKRLVAFDAVDAAFQLVVRDPTLRPLVVGEEPHPGDDGFYADIVVNGAGDAPVRIPSVGPGARVLHARLGTGARDLPFSLWRDGADNWFVQAGEVGRLVMQVSIPRDAFGGPVGDPGEGELRVPSPPPEVRRAANTVAAAIGVDRTSPRRTLAGLVAYFRGFTDSDDPPKGHGNAYLDLALSKKGVCRHRAYAFTITALGLGIPARMVLNEAHAWVEVHDGALWRRIDLGGAGRTLDAPRDDAVVPYEPPPDPYAWPPNAGSGEELGRPGSTGPTGPHAATRTGAPGAGPRSGASDVPPTEWPVDDGAAKGAASGEAPAADRDGARITLVVPDADVHLGAPVQVRGAVESAGEPCARTTVEIALRAPGRGRPVPLGSLATDEAGRFSGVLIVPAEVPAGDYDVVAHTPAATGCAEGFSR